MSFEHYLFTLSARITQHEVGEFQGGYRCDLEYSNPREGRPLSRRWESRRPISPAIWRHLEPASIVSGHDAVFLNQDAVVNFDSRMTLKLGGVEGCFLAAEIRGRADLRECRDAHDKPLAGTGRGEDYVRAWYALDRGVRLPLMLSVAFEVPVEGFNENQTKVYRECRELGRSLLIGVGSATVSRAPWTVEAIELHLCGDLKLPAEPKVGGVS